MVGGMAWYQSWRAYVKSVSGRFAITLHGKMTAFLVNMGVHRKVLNLLSLSGPAGVELGAANQVSVTPIPDSSSATIVWEGQSGSPVYRGPRNQSPGQRSSPRSRGERNG
jgi:hypothetical protein